MWHGQRIYDGFLQLFDDIFEPSNVFERDRDVLRSDNIQGNRLLILRQYQILHPLPSRRSPSSWRLIIRIFRSVKPARDRRGLPLRLFPLLALWIQVESRE